VSRTPLLLQKEEIALARKVRAGDQEAMQELGEAQPALRDLGRQEVPEPWPAPYRLDRRGNVGLLTAARKFDPDQGVKFISYAVWWIRQAILAALARQRAHRARAVEPHR